MIHHGLIHYHLNETNLPEWSWMRVEAKMLTTFVGSEVVGDKFLGALICFISLFDKTNFSHFSCWRILGDFRKVLFAGVSNKPSTLSDSTRLGFSESPESSRSETWQKTYAQLVVSMASLLAYQFSINWFTKHRDTQKLFNERHKNENKQKMYFGIRTRYESADLEKERIFTQTQKGYSTKQNISVSLNIKKVLSCVE